MTPLQAIVEPVRAVLDEVLANTAPDGIDWAAVAVRIAERAALELTDVDMEIRYRRHLDAPPDIQVVLRDLTEPSGDVELIVTHSVWARRQPSVGPIDTWTLAGEAHRV